MATSTVIYPKGTKFNMDYYMKTHMPLVQQKWGPHGLKSWRVIKYPDDAPYCVQATLEWDSMDDFKKAGGSPEAKDVMDDVANFSDQKPTIMTGDVVGTS